MLTALCAAAFAAASSHPDGLEKSTALSGQEPEVVIVRTTTKSVPTSFPYSAISGFQLFGRVEHDVLSNGNIADSPWDSAAYNYAKPRLCPGTGPNLRYYLRIPKGALVFSRVATGDQTGYTLIAAGDWYLEAEAGGTLGTVEAVVKLERNEPGPSHWGDFYFVAAPVGSFVRCTLTYTLLDGAVFSEELLEQTFEYMVTGEIDFSNVLSDPLPLELSIVGPAAVPAGYNVGYRAFLTYPAGPRIEMTDACQWMLKSPIASDLDLTRVTAAEEDIGNTSLQLSATLEVEGEELRASFPITVRPEPILSSPVSWATTQGNSRHDGAVPVSLDDEGFAHRWTHKLTEYPLSSMAVADGRVVVSVERYNFGPATMLFAVDTETGELQWSADLPHRSWMTPPAITAGRVYFQTTGSTIGNFLRCYDAVSGDPVFVSRFDSQSDRDPAPTPYGNRIYMNAGRYGGLYCFDRDNGSLVWTGGLPQVDGWTPAVDEEFVYTYTNYFVLFRRSNGATVVSTSDALASSPNRMVHTAPALGQLQNALIVDDDVLKSFDVDAQEVIWQREDYFSGQPAVHRNRIYVVSNDVLAALDESTGESRWLWIPVNGPLLGQVVATDTHVFVADDSNTYAVSLASREAVWSFPAGGHLAIAAGSLYIASEDGTVTAITLPVKDSEPIPSGWHSADQNQDARITLKELLRVIQLFNSSNYRCASSAGATEDSFRPGTTGDRTCLPHASDYSPQNWRIELGEVLRLIQLFNGPGYAACQEGEDGFCRL